MGMIFAVGFWVVWPRAENVLPSPSEMRAELIARCVAKPDVIAEIQQKLPDNEDGQITPAILRQVLSDVVSHC